MEELMGMSLKEIVERGQEIVNEERVKQWQLEAEKKAKESQLQEVLFERALRLLPKSLHPFTRFDGVRKNNFTVDTHVYEWAVVRTWFGVEYDRSTGIENVKVYLMAGNPFTTLQYRVQWGEFSDLGIQLEAVNGFDDLSLALAWAAEHGDRSMAANDELQSMRGNAASDEPKYEQVRSTAERLADLICELVAERQQF